MLYLIIGAAVILAAIIIPGKYRDNYGDTRTILPFGLRVTAMVAGLAVATLSLLTIVPARNVGVVTSFNKPTGRDLDAGLHLKAPWHRVEDMDGTIQQVDFVGAQPDPENRAVKGRITVRLNTGSLMYVDNAIRWRIVPEAAPELFLDWNSGEGDIVEDRVGPGLVEKEVVESLNVALADYDPFRQGAPGQTYEDLSRKVQDRLKERIGDRVEVVSFNVLGVNFDDRTQSQVEALAEERARTRAAAQRRATITQEALANEELAKSLANPNVLVSRCLDRERLMVERGMPLEFAPSCFPGGDSRVLTTPPQPR